jgi:hypothetical protein
MADRLRVLGQGNGLPILPDPNTGGEDYPLTLTKAQIIEWYWRVRFWTLTTDFKATVRATSLTLDNSLNYTQGPTRERDLILLPSDKTFEATGTAAGPGAASGVSGVSFFNIAPAMYRQPNSADYLPYFLIQGTIAALESGDLSQLVFGSRPADVPGYAGTITANVYGKTLPLYYREDIVDSGTGGTWSFVHTTFDLTPLEWWPYAAEDASPIYDTTDGSQLQSPLN